MHTVHKVHMVHTVHKDGTHRPSHWPHVHCQHFIFFVPFRPVSLTCLFGPRSPPPVLPCAPMGMRLQPLMAASLCRRLFKPPHNAVATLDPLPYDRPVQDASGAACVRRAAGVAVRIAILA